MDTRILTTIIDNFQGGPVGLPPLAPAVGEDGGTIEVVYEPFLIMEGLIRRTLRGREVTEAAYKHLGKSNESKQSKLCEKTKHETNNSDGRNG